MTCLYPPIFAQSIMWHTTFVIFQRVVHRPWQLAQCSLSPSVLEAVCCQELNHFLTAGFACSPVSWRRTAVLKHALFLSSTVWIHVLLLCLDVAPRRTAHHLHRHVATVARHPLKNNYLWLIQGSIRNLLQHSVNLLIVMRHYVHIQPLWIIILSEKYST